jgi:ubiquinone/menaquinone biosynthesis C-methylase UbiE
MIEQARKKKQTNVDFQVVDVHHLPYQSRSFDAIVCTF